MMILAGLLSVQLDLFSLYTSGSNHRCSQITKKQNAVEMMKTQLFQDLNFRKRNLNGGQSFLTKIVCG